MLTTPQSGGSSKRPLPLRWAKAGWCLEQKDLLPTGQFSVLPLSVKVCCRFCMLASPAESPASGTGQCLCTSLCCFSYAGCCFCPRWEQACAGSHGGARGPARACCEASREANLTVGGSGGCRSAYEHVSQHLKRMPGIASGFQSSGLDMLPSRVQLANSAMHLACIQAPWF